MPKGRARGGGHKGQRRHFTNPDELEAQQEKAEKERIWRAKHGDIESDEEEEEESRSSSSEEEEEEGGEVKAKGVQHLIEVSNPNRTAAKTKKVPLLNENTELPQLSRREREELERQKAKAHYMKLHAAGKTEQARQDMARLAIIRKQREEAARKREEEKKAKEAALNAKTEAVNKALGKKT
ncbi:28 kDa heat- and acid-stable phosphoprotein-like [Centruroides sculpturatus]|uniref:28 kDa heat- and acid-stable phosphoprotein-like n=1 Tax=Centruroides sculpturatus TaxID=218467 RepID=UPI000C6E45BE|nr:28 kDa heat- and acid-stable phosphoprotein-like [Centruroides sculpturatus]